MSFSTSPFGQPPSNGGDPVEPFEPFEPEARTREPLDPRVLRSLVAGAAAVAVLGGGAAGFLWLSSSPSGESAQALAGARSTPAVSQPDVVRPGAVAFAGGDPFANNGVTTPAAVDAGSSGSGSSAGGTTGGGTTGGGTTGGTTGTSAGAAPVGTVPRGVGTSPASVPVAKPPVVVAPGSSTTPVSSAPAWVVPKVTFRGGDATGATFDVGGETVQVAVGQLVYPLSVRYEGVVLPPSSTSSSSSSSSSSSTGAAAKPTLKAVLSTEDDTAVGWLVPVGAQLPNAVVGKTSGTAYLYGLLDEQYWVRADRNPGTLIKVGTAVPGTPLSLLGRQVGEYQRAGSDAWFSDGTVTYFGRFGAGEGDGVSY